PMIHPTVIGGDSFLQLRVDHGTTATVSGYRREPFLRFEADGSVFENRASVTFATSTSRYGANLPAGFDERATPDWHRVATNGEYAWHDHHIHWMSNVLPPGKRPGDVVLRSRLPMTVDGAAVVVTVQSVWAASASRLPVWLGAAGGLGVALVVGLQRGHRWSGLAMVAVAVLATVVGWWQYASFPASTGPRPVWLVLPLVAALTASAAVAAQTILTRAALLTLSDVNLLLWAWMRRNGFSRAVLPTNAPGWLDRFAAAMALACGPVVMAFGMAILAVAVLAPRRLTSVT
ncbi:MAG: hypothetical protein WCK21_02150, partial [Actinomycetota bacterium]